MDTEAKSISYKDWTLCKYDPKEINFLKWINSFEFILEMSNTGDDEKVKCLLNMVEPSYLQEIQKSLSPTDPFNLQYDELLIILDNNYLKTQERDIANLRYGFRKQLPHESIEHYVLALRKLFSKCTPFFKSTVPLINRFIAGLSDKETKTLLKKDKNISLATAVAIAKQRELTENQKSGESSSK